MRRFVNYNVLQTHWCEFQTLHSTMGKTSLKHLSALLAHSVHFGMRSNELDWQSPRLSWRRARSTKASILNHCLLHIYTFLEGFLVKRSARNSSSSSSRPPLSAGYSNSAAATAAAVQKQLQQQKSPLNCAAAAIAAGGKCIEMAPTNGGGGGGGNAMMVGVLHQSANQSPTNNV